MTAPAKKAPARRRSPRAAKPQEAPADIPEAVDSTLDELGYVGDDKPIGPDGEIRAVRIGKRGRTPNPMVDLFELDGVMYQIPASPPPVLTFRFQREVIAAQRIKNEQRRTAAHYEATQRFLVALLGQEAFDALAESPDVTEEDVADVFAIVAHVGFGKSKVAEAQGNS